MAGIVHVPWYATVFRGDKLEVAVAEIAPVASSLVDHLQSRRALYLAMLLHDIAKGRGGDHSELGAEVALKVGPALGLSAEETETVSWLVLHHLLLSTVAFKRDIEDPKTILDVADTIQSPERLRLLLVLTVADMRAVSAKVWNGWKAQLLRELYARVAEVLAGTNVRDPAWTSAMLLALEDGFRLHRLIDPASTPADSFFRAVGELQKLAKR